MKRTLPIILLLILSSAFAWGVSVDELIDRLEFNEVHSTSRTVGRLIIEDRFGEKVSTFISYSRGNDESLIEFTSKDEEGQKILRTEDELYLYFPDAEELIRLQGSALKQGILGSDASYEDMAGDASIRETYDVQIIGEETVDGHECYKLKLTAKTRTVAYPIEVVWVDKEHLFARKSQMFSLSERLLKEVRMLEFIEIRGKTIPSRIEMEDKLKKNSLTTFIIEDFELDLELDDDLFSLDELTW